MEYVKVYWSKTMEQQMREQINRATIGAGTIIVDGKTVNPNINRDESKTQIVTKDINVGNNWNWI